MLERTEGEMKIDFSAGRVRPLDPVQAAMLASQCGMHVRKTIHVAAHWKDYSKKGLDHHIPKAIRHVAVSPFLSFFSFSFSHTVLPMNDVSYHSLLSETF